mmetsp:Transcript_33040/g.64829  ORF Transcript_33040/g.64829 Transcript_33040/m.64829 type:complete len:657 (-) Transcript_33040:63-2033(-)
MEDEVCSSVPLDTYVTEINTTCKNLRQALYDLLQLKDSGKEQEMKECQAKCYMMFLELKQLNWDANMMAQQTRSTVKQRKKEQDQQNLNLQGVLYEKSHFIKEVHKCKDFSWSSPEPDLVPEEQFLQAQPQAANSDPHSLQLARLTHELQERQKMLADAEVLKKQISALKQGNQEKKLFLRSVLGEIQTLYNSATSIQKTLLPAPATIPAPESSHLLPRALYNLFNVASCYQQHYDPELGVLVSGNSENAAEFNSNNDASTNSDGLAVAHPLTVVLTASVGGKEVSLVFSYFPSLSCVFVSLKSQRASGAGECSLLNLYPDDDGSELPNNIENLVNPFFKSSSPLPSSSSSSSSSSPPVEELKVEDEAEDETMKESSSSVERDTPQFDVGKYKSAGAPFRWAQALCGIYCNHPRLQRYPAVNLSSVLSRLHQRCLVRQSLQTQLSSLQKLVIPQGVKSSELPFKPKTAFSRWSKCKPDSYFSARADQSSKQWWAAGADYYLASFTRGTVTVHAHIQVTQEYPLRPSNFRLSFEKGNTATRITPNALVTSTADPQALELVMNPSSQANVYNNDIKDMETEINTNFDCSLVELAESETRGERFVLSQQLQKLQLCVDVFFDSAKSEQVHNNLYSEAVRGRDRRKPYVYNPQEGAFFCS